MTTIKGTQKKGTTERMTKKKEVEELAVMNAVLREI